MPVQCNSSCGRSAILKVNSYYYKTKSYSFIHNSSYYIAFRGPKLEILYVRNAFSKRLKTKFTKLSSWISYSIVVSKLLLLPLVVRILLFSPIPWNYWMNDTTMDWIYSSCLLMKASQVNLTFAGKLFRFFVILPYIFDQCRLPRWQSGNSKEK